MPRPRRTRAASTRTDLAAKDPSRAPERSNASDHEEESTNLRRSSRGLNPRPTAAIEDARQKRDSAMQRLENITSTSSLAENTTAEGEDSEGSSVEVEMGRRATATPAHGRAVEMSGLDLDDEMFDDLNTTFDTAGTASAQRSHDTSTLSVSHFKRRPRAASFLSRDDGTLRPSSRAGPNTPAFSSTFNIGMFKRRAREPSILGTAQKPRAERPVPQSDSGDKSDNDPEDDGEVEKDNFDPEAESTPLRRSNRQSGASVVDAELLVLPNPKTRKRKSTEAHEERARSSPFAEQEPAGQLESEFRSSPPALDRISSRTATPALDEDIAPPESSGSEDEAEVWPPIQCLARSRPKRSASTLRRTPARDDSPSDMSSPPSLTYSPNYAEDSPPPQRKQTRRSASKTETKVTTAHLTGLLPRRRNRSARTDQFGLEDSDPEIDTSGLGDDDDELTHIDARTRRRAARPLSRAASASRNANTRGRAAERKGKATERRTTRTYGKVSSDQENEGENESPDQAEDDGIVAAETSEMMVARIGDELKNAARKFAEVDRWELDFEEMTQSSSPPR
ncbi:hypothetical protein BX600DRAFT_456333 [Xylariales sp. PMI_506]|nr:hypothetical protein BX600DRAFT_456333 [Xylariales sp. PMI_506]